jgi:eukaryotic-like serine/threonine-protein kinase
MSGNPRVFALLEEILETGRTPEEVCRDHPELLSEVRQRWRDFRLIDQEVSAFLPPSHNSDAGPPTPDPADLPQVSGYRVEAVLGQGGMGIVYKAWHLRLQRPVALKMLLAGDYAKPAERERFQREAEAIAALVHPNIVQVHDVGEVGERPYFTMELVDGGDLAKQIQGTPQPARKAAGLVATLADVVQAAHQRGIVHRDLKPANVLLTSDGTPKVTDFGLAQRLEGGEGLTLSGTPLGTPSYMAPEQARGNRDAIGPATDIYALGAILYELLTGRPPFRAESGMATLQQVMADDPVPPARLNRRVPRDLETICLKCLHKEPQRRYASAQALAEDLRRFERGEPIAARPPGAVEHAARWVRRRPTLAAALAAGVLLASALVVTVVWWHGQRTALEATAVAYAEADLSESEGLRNRGEFKASAEVLQRARDRLGEFVPPKLRDRLRAAFENLELVTRLESIRLSRVVIVQGRQNRARSDRDYTEEFRAAGLAAVGDDPAAVAARLAASPVKRELVAALDDWAVCTDDVPRRTWLMDVARKADPDPWRDRVRDPDPKAWKDRTRLAELARTAPLERESPHQLVALGSRLQDDGGDRDAVAFLRRVQRAHPADFFANYMLACALRETGDAMAAVGHFRAALAVRPDAANAWYGLGLALYDAGRLDEAETALSESVRLAPTHGWAHAQLGLVLRKQNKPDQAIDHLQQAVRFSRPAAWMQTELARALQDRQRWEEAIHCYREAARLDPDNPSTHYDLGMALNTPGRQDEAIQHLRKSVSLGPSSAVTRRALGSVLLARDRPDEAVEHFRAAIGLEPNHAEAQQALRTALIRLGRLGDARAAWKKALQAGSPEHDAWFGYAELCLFLGKKEEFRSARSELLARFRDTTEPHVAERVGRACLLLPGSDDELRQAVALTERAKAAADPKYDWARPYFHFAKGLADYRLGRFDEAIAVMSGEAKNTNYIGPSSRLVMAMALYRKGNTKEARAALAAAVDSYDWSPAKADNRDVWIPHILRREAEAIIGAVRAEPGPLPRLVPAEARPK